MRLMVYYMARADSEAWPYPRESVHAESPYDYKKNRFPVTFVWQDRRNHLQLASRDGCHRPLTKEKHMAKGNNRQQKEVKKPKKNKAAKGKK